MLRLYCIKFGDLRQVTWRFEAKSFGDLRISIWRFEAKLVGDLEHFWRMGEVILTLIKLNNWRLTWFGKIMIDIF